MPNRFLHQAADQGSDPSGRCTGEHRPWLCLPAGRRARRAPKEMLFVKKYSMSPSEKQTRNSHSVKRQEVGEGGRQRREERREPLVCGLSTHLSIYRMIHWKVVQVQPFKPLLIVWAHLGFVFTGEACFHSL